MDICSMYKDEKEQGYANGMITFPEFGTWLTQHFNNATREHALPIFSPELIARKFFI